MHVALSEPLLVTLFSYLESILRSTIVDCIKKGICEGKKHILIQYMRSFKTNWQN